MSWFQKAKVRTIEEMRRCWWRELLMINEQIRDLQYQLNRHTFNSFPEDSIRAKIWRLRHKLAPLAEKLGLNDAAAELPFKRTEAGNLPEIPEWLLRREIA